MSIDVIEQALTNPTLLFAAACAAAMTVALVLIVARSGSQTAQLSRMDASLRAIAATELDLDTSLVPVTKKDRTWSEYWHDQVTLTGREVRHPQGPGRWALGVLAFGGAVGFFAFPGGVVGAATVPIAALVGFRAFLGMEQKKRIAVIDKQLPTLLAGLRANLAAQSTPQQALMDVSNDMPAPLGDELRALRRDINVNVGLDEALTSLGERVSSREMKFLVSSIQISVRSGADLAPQIETIQEIVSQRTRIRQKLRAAVAQVKPTQFLALAAVPFMFIVSLRDPEQRLFWFSDGLFWLIVGAVLYAAGALVIKFMVNSVENT